MDYSRIHNPTFSMFAAGIRLAFSICSDEKTNILRYTRMRRYTYVSQKREANLSIFQVSLKIFLVPVSPHAPRENCPRHRQRIRRTRR